MTFIIVLILISIVLIFIEVFFIPGTTIVGVLGLIFAIIGIYYAYNESITIGNITLAVTIIIFTATIIIGSKSGVWSKLSNKDAITSKVNIIDNTNLVVGTQGKAISAIRPIGKARINGKNYEVKSLGEYINTGSTVEIIKIQGNKIIVKLVENI